MLALLLTLACTPSWKKMSGEELLADLTADDGDSVEGAADQCPQAREDIDGFQDEDGCPDLDNDLDGFPDRRDACPDEKGGEPWVVDSLDGCKPWSDRDGDGIHDDDDACPDKAERVNGVNDEDGCPDFKVVVTKERIDFDQKVMFATGTADLEPVSLDLLQAIAQVMIDNPQVLLVEVGGHTDDVGSDASNKKLSQARAEAVVAQLVVFGVAPGRLSAKGYGESKPVIKDTTEEARAANRRVEFVVKAARPAPPAPAAGPRGRAGTGRAGLVVQAPRM